MYKHLFLILWQNPQNQIALRSTLKREGMMKRFHVAALLRTILVLCAALAIAATASAQAPSEFVIGGETAKKIHDYTTINLATAERLAETCERLARAEGVAI